MTSRRLSASLSASDVVQPPQRRGAARFAGALVEPSHAAILQRSPVNTAAAANLKPHHSTPQPARRTLFSRLFRAKTGRHPRSGTYEEDGDDASSAAATSPGSHQSTPTHRPAGAAIPSALTATRDDDAEEKQPSSRHGRVLMEGMLTKLSSHKYWHAKASYFVLAETATSGGTSRICLKQYRRRPEDDGDDEDTRSIGVIVLSEVDVVVDISDRYIKHGIELLHRFKASSAHDARFDTDADLEKGEPLCSLRLRTDDSGAHRKWMRALGSAVARLVDQSKRHYPITPADVNFARENTTVFEPDAVSTIVTTAVPIRSIARVMPMASDADDGDETQQTEEENQRQDEMRGPEEPEVHTDPEPDDDARSSFSITSDGFSDAWASPHNNNNNHEENHWDGSDDAGNNQRSSNQLDDSEDEADGQRTRRLSSRFNSPDTNSVASTPSPFARTTTISRNEEEDEDIRLVAVSMAASAIVDELATPPSSPPPPPPLSSSSITKPRTGPALPRFGTTPNVHSFNANGQVFTLDVRYELLKSIGNGAYGAVIAVKDALTDTSLAVKKITNIFDDLVDAKRILREVRLLRHFHHKNITELLDLAPPPRGAKTFDDMYIITELMETDLHQVIYSMQPMSDDHVKYFLYQMLCALYHIHSAGVIHRDMKPSNILLNSNCDLKVCDFGLARGGMDDAHTKPKELTEYVVTRWYRAPEIMLNCLTYTAAVDVWAVGCIFAEMLLREPLFPGNDYIHQLKLIIKFLGTPKQEDTAFVRNAKALRFLTKLSISKPRKWREVFTGDDVNPLALDLLAQMLIFNPEKRISVEKALQHPYFATFYDPADITHAAPFAFEFDLPDERLSRDALVDLLSEDIACFHPTLMHQWKQATHAPLPMPMVPRPTANASNRYYGATASAS